MVIVITLSARFGCRWNNNNNMEKIYIEDNTIRDGFQQVGIRKDFNTVKKTIKLINELDIDSVEIGMCVSEFDYHMMIKKLSYLDSSKLAVVLCRLIESDIKQAINLRKMFNNVRVKLLIPASDLHIEKKIKQNKSNFLLKIKEMQKLCSANNVSVNACIEDATRADKSYLLKILDVCDYYNNKFVTIADTVGFCTPMEYGDLINFISKQNYKFKISTHCHNDLGLATANTIAGVINGARQIEATLLGIGERAGNAALDEVLYILAEKQKCDVICDHKKVYVAGRRLEELINFKSSPLKPLIGCNVFKHESGIHQHGMKIDRNMYQFVDNRLLGISDNYQQNEDISYISSSELITKLAAAKSCGFTGSNNIESHEFTDYFRKVSYLLGSVPLERVIELYEYSKRNN